MSADNHEDGGKLASTYLSGSVRRLVLSQGSGTILETGCEYCQSTSAFGFALDHNIQQRQDWLGLHDILSVNHLDTSWFGLLRYVGHQL